MSRRGSARLEHARARVAAERVKPSFRDWALDGTPDFLRLDDDSDREAFRRWFAFLAEAQYFAAADERPSEIVDCAALARYAYREALRRHDSAWAGEAHLPLMASIASVQKYSFPHTPLGPALYRLRPGPFLPGDVENGAFGQFANAQTLQRFNTFLVSRNAAASMRGDLFFFRRGTEGMPFHTMIFIGHSQVAPSALRYVVYDTGPREGRRGEIKRLSMDEVLSYPDPQWRPVAANPNFLGVFRWNILRTGS